MHNKINFNKEEEKKNVLEEISLNIISNCVEAKSLAFEGLKIVKETKDALKADELIEKAEKMIIEAEKEHMSLIVDESKGVKRIPSILFIHAEDQLLSTQTIIMLIREIIELHLLRS